MLNSAAESEIDDLDESKVCEADDDSPSDNADGQQFNCEPIDCLMISNELYRIVEASDQEMLDKFHNFRYILGRQSHKRVLGDLETFTLTQDEENIPQAMALYDLHEP
ncbi:hypothetical protein X797_007735 [Metarhizium robertsii]|uniref:Uncharacterized protein n=2 Tax=Metarhizium robertsii TaxID=568076 RepID=E9EM32_METRA|nr:uncharacterized protein MAA_01077 [Metarhizium robertsii ARSEF 23]EFZ04003.1 hypothetical protein MAA_01077 [Metarhizium robertsii ARSEF 23]EXU99017.1 hypothetical protein X797_007735 [Metarhizium robertsii]